MPGWLPATAAGGERGKERERERQREGVRERGREGGRKREEKKHLFPEPQATTKGVSLQKWSGRGSVELINPLVTMY